MEQYVNKFLSFDSKVILHKFIHEYSNCSVFVMGTRKYFPYLALPIVISSEKILMSLSMNRIRNVFPTDNTILISFPRDFVTQE